MTTSTAAHTPMLISCGSPVHRQHMRGQLFISIVVHLGSVKGLGSVTEWNPQQDQNAMVWELARFKHASCSCHLQDFCNMQQQRWPPTIFPEAAPCQLSMVPCSICNSKYMTFQCSTAHLVEDQPEQIEA